MEFLDKKILVAEDDIINQILMSSVLKNLKMNFTIVNNGKEALEILKNNSFDIILLDIQMPLLNGLETVLEIRKNNIKTPVVALSADKLNFEMEEIEKYGFNESLTKPIEIEALENLFFKYLV
ncbi:MAG: response regulator [Bacteroidetes bacterium]|nr:MAG: response regulator [Bacteroidota bacterium]TAG91868.1 MAG: response regulator [Bacteroidota bacterium]